MQIARRVPAVAAAVLVVAAGLGVRALEDGGTFAKYAGVALYGTLAYTVVVVLAPRTRPGWSALIALAGCWLIELAQLTPVPAALSADNTLARLVLGSTFNAPDLAWYAVGVGVAGGVHWLVMAVRRATSGGAARLAPPSS